MMITFNIIIYLIVQPYLQVPVFQVPALTVFHLCTPKDTNLYYIRIYLPVNSGGTFFFIRTCKNLLSSLLFYCIL